MKYKNTFILLIILAIVLFFLFKKKKTAKQIAKEEAKKKTTPKNTGVVNTSQLIKDARTIKNPAAISYIRPTGTGGFKPTKDYLLPEVRTIKNPAAISYPVEIIKSTLQTAGIKGSIRSPRAIKIINSTYPTGIIKPTLQTAGIKSSIRSPRATRVIKQVRTIKNPAAKILIKPFVLGVKKPLYDRVLPNESTFYL